MLTADVDQTAPRGSWVLSSNLPLVRQAHEFQSKLSGTWQKSLGSTSKALEPAVDLQRATAAIAKSTALEAAQLLKHACVSSGHRLGISVEYLPKSRSNG